MVSLICPVEQTGWVLFVNLQLFTGEACLRRECASDSRVVLGGGGQSLAVPCRTAAKLYCSSKESQACEPCKTRSTQRVRFSGNARSFRM